MLPAPQPHNGPAALARPLSFEEVAQHRNIFCGRYAMCLEVVVNRRWTSFTCRHCSLWAGPPSKTTTRPGTLLFFPSVRK